MTRLFLALACLALASTAVPSDSPEEEVRATLQAMWDALERMDVEAYGAHLHPGFSAFGENDAYLREGKDHDLRSYRDYLARARNLHTDMHQPKVTVRGDTAWITYYWTEAADVDGRRVTSRGKSTRIFVKEGGRWLCIHGHYTAVP